MENTLFKNSQKFLKSFISIHFVLEKSVLRALSSATKHGSRVVGVHQKNHLTRDIFHSIQKPLLHTLLGEIKAS